MRGPHRQVISAAAAAVVATTCAHHVRSATSPNPAFQKKTKSKESKHSKSGAPAFPWAVAHAEGAPAVISPEAKVSYCVHATRGPRASMEDFHFVSPDASFFAVYDGHGGPSVASAASNVWRILEAGIRDDVRKKTVSGAIKKAFFP